MLLLLWKSRSSKSVRKEGSKEEQKCTHVASHSTPSTGALKRFCEFFSCMQLEYCLRETLSKFEGLSTFYCNFINVNILCCIYGTYTAHSYYTYYRTYNKCVVMVVHEQCFSNSVLNQYMYYVEAYSYMHAHGVSLKIEIRI